jgi:hypothetical protein
MTLGVNGVFGWPTKAERPRNASPFNNTHDEWKSIEPASCVGFEKNYVSGSVQIFVAASNNHFRHPHIANLLSWLVKITRLVAVPSACPGLAARASSTVWKVTAIEPKSPVG